MARLRRVFFFAFALVYVLAAPLTVLYALGFIFNPGEQTLVQTGLVSLVTEPSGANVWVDGTLSKDKTPLVLRNLRPGIHDIEVNLPAHHTWQKRVKIIPERALRFESILLFPQIFEPEIVNDFPVSQLWHVPGGKYLAALHGG